MQNAKCKVQNAKGKIHDTKGKMQNAKYKIIKKNTKYKIPGQALRRMGSLLLSRIRNLAAVLSLGFALAHRVTESMQSPFKWKGPLYHIHLLKHLQCSYWKKKRL